MKLRTHANEEVAATAATPQGFGRVNVLPGGAPPPRPWTPLPEPEPVAEVLPEPEPVAEVLPEPEPVAEVRAPIAPPDPTPYLPVPPAAVGAEPAFTVLPPPDPSDLVPLDVAPPVPVLEPEPAIVPVEAPYSGPVAVPVAVPVAAPIATEWVEPGPEPIVEQLPEPLPEPIVEQLPPPPPPKAAPIVADGPLLPAPTVVPGAPLVVPLGAVTPLPGFMDPSDPAWPTSLPAHAGRHLRSGEEVAAAADGAFADPYPMAAAIAASQAGLVFSDGARVATDPSQSTGFRSLANRMLHRS